MNFWHEAVYGTSFGSDPLERIQEHVVGHHVHVVAQQHELWRPRLPTLPDFRTVSLPASGTTYIALARHPVARYVSAYKNKVACFGKDSPGSGDRRQMVPELLKLSRATIVPRSVDDANGPAPCLDFDQFVHALSAIHKVGNAYLLNSHFLPQNVSLASCKGGLYVPVFEMTGLVPSLVRTFGLHNRTMAAAIHTSPSTEDWNITRSGLLRLCEVARPEMRWFGSAAPPEEAPYHCAET